MDGMVQGGITDIGLIQSKNMALGVMRVKFKAVSV
jgi:hypothetical protein